MNNKFSKGDDEVYDGPIISARYIGDELLIFFEGPIQSTMMHSLVNVLNDYDCSGKFSLVINSGGGDPAFLMSFYAFAKELGLTSIFGVGQASSAALAMMLDCKSHRMPVYIDKLCYVVLHRLRTTWIGEERSERIVEYNDKWVKPYEDRFDAVNKKLLSKLTASQKKDYKDGRDVYLFGYQLIEMGIFEEIKPGLFSKTGKKK